MFGKLPTVDGVMKDFHKKIKELQDVIEAQDNEADNQSAIIQEASDKRSLAYAESAKAVRLKEKFEALFD